MTWNEWVEFRFDNRTDKDIAIANLKSEYGWSYNLGDIGRVAREDSEINGREILSKTDDNGFGHRGRGSAMSGSEGAFDLIFKGESTKLCHVYWNCPYWFVEALKIDRFEQPTDNQKVPGQQYHLH